MGKNGIFQNLIPIFGSMHGTLEFISEVWYFSEKYFSLIPSTQKSYMPMRLFYIYFFTNSTTAWHQDAQAVMEHGIFDSSLGSLHKLQK